MGGRKVEGNEEMKRKAAREARRAGKAPSAVDATTGAPQQRRHLGGKTEHEQKLAARHHGQQTPPKSRGG